MRTEGGLNSGTWALAEGMDFRNILEIKVGKSW